MDKIETTIYLLILGYKGKDIRDILNVEFGSAISNSTIKELRKHINKHVKVETKPRDDIIKFLENIPEELYNKGVITIEPHRIDIFYPLEYGYKILIENLLKICNVTISMPFREGSK